MIYQHDIEQFDRGLTSSSNMFRREAEHQVSTSNQRYEASEVQNDDSHGDEDEDQEDDDEDMVQREETTE
jgi:hypothetical protein